MMKAKYYKLFSLLSMVLVFVAALNIKPASAGYAYQPKVPKCLNNNKK